MVLPSGCGSSITRREAASSSAVMRSRISSICARVRSPRASSFFSISRTQSVSSLMKFAPDDDEWPYRRETWASRRNGLRSVRTYSIASASSRYAVSGSLPSIVFVRMPKARPRSLMRLSPCCVAAGVEIPYWLFVTIMRHGTSLPGREHQMRHVAKSPSAVPASPPCTIVIPRPP